MKAKNKKIKANTNHDKKLEKKLTMMLNNFDLKMGKDRVRQ